MRITSSSKVLGILQGLQSFSAPGVVPGDVPLEPSDTLLGVLASKGSPPTVLLDNGAYVKINDDWHFAPYGAVEVQVPLTEGPDSPLVLVTSHGSVEVLSGTPDAAEAARFFMKCAEDFRAA